MTMIRTMAAVLLAVAVAWVPPAAAAERVPFTAARFAQAQAQGLPILVDIAASWCPICKAQNSVIEKEVFKPEFAKLVIFEVDFDQQKNVVQQFNASMQGTLIVFNGRKETARLVGETDPNAIDALMHRAI